MQIINEFYPLMTFKKKYFRNYLMEINFKNLEEQQKNFSFDKKYNNIETQTLREIKHTIINIDNLIDMINQLDDKKRHKNEIDLNVNNLERQNTNLKQYKLNINLQPDYELKKTLKPIELLKSHYDLVKSNNNVCKAEQSIKDIVQTLDIIIESKNEAFEKNLSLKEQNSIKNIENDIISINNIEDSDESCYKNLYCCFIFLKLILYILIISYLYYSLFNFNLSIESSDMKKNILTSES